MPARRSVRLLLLDQVAQAFEPGRRYPEAVVSDVLKSLYDDHAALRRYLIDEELMSRTADGTYWRSGGTVPTGPPGVGSLPLSRFQLKLQAYPTSLTRLLHISGISDTKVVIS